MRGWKVCKKWGWSPVKVLKGNLLNDGGDVEEDDKGDYEDKEGASEG